MDAYQLAGSKALATLGIYEPNLERYSEYFTLDEIIGAALHTYQEQPTPITFYSTQVGRKLFVFAEKYDATLREYSSKRKFSDYYVIIDDDVPAEIYEFYAQLAYKTMLEAIRSSAL